MEVAFGGGRSESGFSVTNERPRNVDQTAHSTPPDSRLDVRISSSCEAVNNGSVEFHLAVHVPLIGQISPFGLFVALFEKKKKKESLRVSFNNACVLIFFGTMRVPISLKQFFFSFKHDDEDDNSSVSATRKIRNIKTETVDGERLFLHRLCQFSR